MPSKQAAPDPSATAVALVTWFEQHGRDYPWRRTQDAYAILVSEIMLQQTQISTVLERGFYSRWMQRFPNWKMLAEADESQVLMTWEGLGYYRRARHLQRLAQVVMTAHGGVLPSDHSTLLKLPGIGPYTAGAVASFAFGQAQPIVDGNIARVLARMYNDATPIDSTDGKKRLWERAAAMVQATDDPRSLNSALMELGQTLCRPTKPTCELCPANKQCRATDPDSLPVKSPRAVITQISEHVIFLRSDDGVLLECETGSRRTGLWKLPTVPTAFENHLPPVLLKAHYGITRYKVTLWVHQAPSDPIKWSPACAVIPLAELQATPMPSPYRRALDQLLKQSDFALQA
jgi:A/G-specific adenine glycosylase